MRLPRAVLYMTASAFGFFSTRIAIDSVFGTELETPIGTTAPFSAMSGVCTNAMSLLCAGAPPPSAFMTSSSVFASNAFLFHACASASPGCRNPAAASSVNSVTPPPVLSTSLRCMSIVPPPPRTSVRL